jgi:hypothetical protein
MLEHLCLLVEPWISDEEGWARRITDPEGHYLGVVRYAPSLRIGWFAWLRKLRLDVFESEDGSHLCTLTRAWGVSRRWQVIDAEETLIGVLNRGALFTSEGGLLGELEGTLHQGTMTGTMGEPLASYRRQAGAVLQLRFATEAMGNPFLRMLLLATVVVLDPLPR